MKPDNPTAIPCELVGGPHDGAIIEIHAEHPLLNYKGAHYHYECTRDRKLIFTHWRN